MSGNKVSFSNHDVPFYFNSILKVEFTLSVEVLM